MLLRPTYLKITSIIVSSHLQALDCAILDEGCTSLSLGAVGVAYRMKHRSASIEMDPETGFSPKIII